MRVVVGFREVDRCYYIGSSEFGGKIILSDRLRKSSILDVFSLQSLHIFCSSTLPWNNLGIKDCF